MSLFYSGSCWIYWQLKWRIWNIIRWTLFKTMTTAHFGSSYQSSSSCSLPSHSLPTFFCGSFDAVTWWSWKKNSKGSTMHTCKTVKRAYFTAEWSQRICSKSARINIRTKINYYQSFNNKFSYTRLQDKVLEATSRRNETVQITLSHQAANQLFLHNFQNDNLKINKF